MSRHGRHARPVLYTYLLGEYEYDRDFTALNKDDRYLPRDRRFMEVLPFDLREDHLTRPSHLFEDVEALPLRQFAPPWVQNRYVHIALCHDPRKRPRPGYLKAYTTEEQFYLGMAHAALLGHKPPTPSDGDRAVAAYRRWLRTLSTYVWMYDPRTTHPRKIDNLPGTPYDDLRYQNAHATLSTMKAALRSLGADPPKNFDEYLDAYLPHVLNLHQPRRHGEWFYTSKRQLPLLTPSFLGPSPDPSPPKRRSRYKRTGRPNGRPPMKPKSGEQLKKELRERRQARKQATKQEGT